MRHDIALHCPGGTKHNTKLVVHCLEIFRISHPLCWLLLALMLIGFPPHAHLDAAETSPNGNGTPTQAAAEPSWIWCTPHRSAGVSARFRTQFDVNGQLRSAVLRGAGESASLQIELDGKTLARLDAYAPLFQQDLRDRLSIGTHTLTVDGTSYPGPAAFFIHLELTCEDGSRQTVVSDSSWEFARSDNDATSTPRRVTPAWRPVYNFGGVCPQLIIERGRQTAISATDDYEQWRQASGEPAPTDPAKFFIAAGFQIERVRDARPDEDSWVSMAFDGKGRILIAKEKRGLLRMTLSDDGARVTEVETIEDTLQECRGLLYVDGNLYVNANNSKGCYRLRGDSFDGFEAPELLFASAGGVGHGRNDLTLGPDGKIYLIHGDSVELPAQCVDFTSPYREARRGRSTSEGHLLRIDRDGGKIELLASGLRNPFGIDFHPDGELFTYDADAEYDMGAPWYRPTRVNHLVIGGDYGWRGVTSAWPPYYPDHPDNALSNFDIGKGSPTAVKFGTRSSYPEPYREALFILDWAYGRILAVHCIPRGSSYLLTAETFLKGRPLNVTDLDFGPDGCMYLVTGGRATTSSIYRVRYVASRSGSPTPPTTQQRERKTFAARSRQLRRQLEMLLHNGNTDLDPEDVWPHLANPDPWIRYAARNGLERIPIPRWSDQALAESDQTAAATALLALSRGAPPAVVPTILRRLNAMNWSRASDVDRIAALYSYDLCLAHGAAIDPQLLSTVIQRLDVLYPASSFQANQWLSKLLVQLEAPSAINKTIQLMTSTDDQSERLHYLFVLRHALDRASVDQRKLYFTLLNDGDQFVGGAGMPIFLAKIREEAVAALDPAERTALSSLLDNAQRQGEPKATPNREFVRKWNLAALEDVLDQLDHERDLARGRQMFVDAQCYNCHRIGGLGRLVGPDLTSVSRRFSRRDILQAILEPSRVVADDYRSLQIITRDGKNYVGQAVLGGDYRSSELRLRTSPLDPTQVATIPKAEIEARYHSPISWMPEGLLDTLSQSEILDLLAFLEAGGQVTAATEDDRLRLQGTR